jgi:type I restriction enzyme S subunit
MWLPCCVNPKLWTRRRWGDLATLEYGKALRGYQTGSNTGYPVFGTNGPIGWHADPLFPSQGVIVGRKGAYRAIYFSREPCWVIDTAFYLKLKDRDAVEPRFAYYQLKTVNIDEIDSGSAIPSTSRPAFYQIPINLPPLQIQRKIVAILAAYDDLIENNNRRIKLLEEMAGRIYREWFIDFRYACGEKPTPPPLASVPLGWRLGKLGELARVNALTIKRIDLRERIRYIDIASVSSGTFQSPTPMALAEAPGRARRRVADGDILWSTVRPNLRAYALMLDPGPDCVASTGFAVLSPRATSFAYIYCLTTSDGFVEYLSQRATGSAYPAVTPAVFSEAPALIPSEDALSAFAEIVEPLLRLASKLRAQSTILAKAREFLLPGLIAGEIEVSGLDIAIPPDAA